MAEEKKPALKLDDKVVNAVELGEWVGLSKQTVDELALKNVMVRIGPGQFLLRASILAYCNKQRIAASGRGTPGEKDRDRIAAANAGIAEQKLKAMRGDLVPSSEVELEWSKRFQDIRAGLLAYVGNVSGILPHLSQTDCALLDQEMRRTLTDIADGKYDIEQGRRPPGQAAE